MSEEEKIEQLSEPLRTQAKIFISHKPEDLPENPEKNKWYVYRPTGCICSTGDPYYSTLKIGSENKLMVVFIGGGAAIDAYSAARPSLYAPQEEGETFYIPDTFIAGYFLGHNGLGKVDDERNPFRNWSVVIVSYASGDFHCGTGDFSYNDSEKGKGICYHHGYINYRAMIEKMKDLIPEPVQLFVTGFSAGGFGTALLTDDVISLFPNCKDVICFPDSSILVYSDWRTTAEKQWKAPKQIHEKLVSDNLTLDCLQALKQKYGEKVKIMFACSFRDALLAQAQSYADGNHMIFSEEAGDRFQQILAATVSEFRRTIPDISLFIFDKLHPEIKIGALTEHCFTFTDFTFDLQQDGIKAIDWIVDSVQGKPMQVGIELLKIK